MANFRRRCALFSAQYPTVTNLTREQCESLMSSASISKLERSILDNPTVRHNYRQMYHQIMQNGSNTWKAIDYLQKLKSTLPGFDFRVHKDEQGLPDGIVWMTLQMRKLLLQCGDYLCLDFQERNYNKLGWPYSGVAVYTN